MYTFMFLVFLIVYCPFPSFSLACRLLLKRFNFGPYSIVSHDGLSSFARLLHSSQDSCSSGGLGV